MGRKAAGADAAGVIRGPAGGDEKSWGISKAGLPKIASLYLRQPGFVFGMKWHRKRPERR